MENFLIYLFQVSIGMVLFYLFYLLVLRKETFYTPNRLYLVSGLILAVLLPAFPISYISSVAIQNNASFFKLSENQVGEFLPIAGIAETSSSWWSDPIYIISAIYLFGIAFFGLRLIIQTIAVIIKKRHGKRMIFDGVSVVDVSQEIMPFSFFNSVLINIKAYSKEELSNIIAHEKVHIQERHWIDLLIIELLTIVFWINPIVWLYERSIKQNHEYLADQGVLLAGYNPGQYQALLINQLMGVKILGFTNNLNFSLNKKRMEMMKKKKSPVFNRAKLLIVLPLIAMLVFAFAKKEYVVVEPNNNNISIANSLSDQLKISGMVQNNKSEPLVSVVIIVKGKNTGTISDMNGQFLIEAPTDAELVFAHTGYETQIHKVSTLSDKSAVVTLAFAERKSSSKTIKLNGTVKGEGGTLLTGASVVIQNTSTGTVVDENGKFKLEVPDNSRIVISYVGYQTVSRGITSDFSNDNEFNVTYTLAKGVYDINLPEFTDEEIIEVSPPPLKGTKGEVYTVVEEMPIYKNGGMQKLAQDLKIMTTEATKHTTDRGEAIVRFTVSAEGKVIKVQIAESSGSAVLDDVAVKFIRKLDNWNPGNQRGKKVPVDLKVPIKFN